ncbi:MAG: ATP-dependent Clp protease proteolytic subunit [Cyanobacteria bacterium SZAS LIN-5]|nr:ATP-dependent Clp protease proteolytic subunit [Cyanobacteria bacterium SZAS LIN-5]RTL34735.1 MAG: ATP-dependent Clp protease proteolytic subunit [Candidatus Melainabacteria bacterium]
MKKKNQPAPATPGIETPAKVGTRDIFLFGRLENEITLPVIKKLIKLNKANAAEPINLYINSAGGNGYNADAIIAVMHSLQAPVNTICLGHALSGACEILASGTGTRSAYEFSTLMFHQTLWEADGDITNLEIQAAQGKRFREAQIELLHRCTGQDKSVVKRDIERDHYMSAREALDYGIIDSVLTHDRVKSNNGGNNNRASSGSVSSKKLSAKAAHLGSGKSGSKSTGKTPGRPKNGKGR